MSIKSGIAWLDDAINEIDAGVFSSDTFNDQVSYNVLSYYVQRWQRALDSIVSRDDDEDKGSD